MHTAKSISSEWCIKRRFWDIVCSWLMRNLEQLTLRYDAHRGVWLSVVMHTAEIDLAVWCTPGSLGVLDRYNNMPLTSQLWIAHLSQHITYFILDGIIFTLERKTVRKHTNQNQMQKHCRKQKDTKKCKNERKETCIFVSFCRRRVEKEQEGIIMQGSKRSIQKKILYYPYVY